VNEELYNKFSNSNTENSPPRRASKRDHNITMFNQQNTSGSFEKSNEDFEREISSQDITSPAERIYNPRST
jgi:hypothetical protein